MTRIDDAVSRILTAKFELGLFEHPLTDRRHIHRSAARRTARSPAMRSPSRRCCCKNRGRTLPLRPRAKVYVAGSNADNIGNQAGGWTLTWQGGSTNVIPGDRSSTASRRSEGVGDLQRDATARVPRGADGIVVVGETPYAEGFGDVGGPQWAYDPGDNNVPRPEKTMQLSDADKAGDAEGVRRAATCTVVVVSRVGRW